MNPKVSILVPIYNVAPFIERCAESLLGQTLQDIEYIFVNDCTPDNSMDILERVIARYPDRIPQIKVHHHASNQGIAATRNTLISLASGDFTLFVDSDDYIELDTVELLYNKAQEEQADIVTCNFIQEWSKASRIFSVPPFEGVIDFRRKLLSGNIPPSIWSKLIRRKLYTEHHIRAIEGANLGEDVLVVTKLSYYAQKIAHVNKPLIHYMQTNPFSYTKRFDKNLQDLLVVMEELERFFKAQDDYVLYQQSLLQGMLRKKIDLILVCGKQYWDRLFTLFPETSFLTDMSFLSRREKMVYFFMKNKQQWLLRGYVYFYHSLVGYAKKLLGRV